MANSLSVKSLPWSLRSTGRAADTSRDGQVTKTELEAYQSEQRSNWQKPAFIIGDLFPFLDPATRNNRRIEKNVARAAQIIDRFDA